MYNYLFAQVSCINFIATFLEESCYTVVGPPLTNSMQRSSYSLNEGFPTKWLNKTFKEFDYGSWYIARNIPKKHSTLDNY